MTQPLIPKPKFAQTTTGTGLMPTAGMSQGGTQGRLDVLHKGVTRATGGRNPHGSQPAPGRLPKPMMPAPAASAPAPVQVTPSLSQSLDQSMGVPAAKLPSAGGNHVASLIEMLQASPRLAGSISADPAPRPPHGSPDTASLTSMIRSAFAER